MSRHYKSAPDKLYDDVNSDAKLITEKLSVGDRVQTLAKSEAYLTLKDDKTHFENTLPCRLINPAKSEINRTSKSILDRILLDVCQKTRANLWKNTASVIQSFETYLINAT